MREFLRNRLPSRPRHSARRILVRLQQAYGFSGSYTIVKDYVRERRRRLREVFFPLERRPGTSQVDFGSARVVIAGQELKAHVFCMALPYSDAIFVGAYRTEALGAFQEGHKALLRFKKQLARKNLVIVDEFGYAPFSKTGAELLFEFFAERYERSSVIVTTNLPFDQWTEVLGSERLTGALLDRLTDRVQILEMNGESYRFRESVRRLYYREA